MTVTKLPGCELACSQQLKAVLEQFQRLGWDGTPGARDVILALTIDDEEETVTVPLEELIEAMSAIEAQERHHIRELVDAIMCKVEELENLREGDNDELDQEVEEIDQEVTELATSYLRVIVQKVDDQADGDVLRHKQVLAARALAAAVLRYDTANRFALGVFGELAGEAKHFHTRAIELAQACLDGRVWDPPDPDREPAEVVDLAKRRSREESSEEGGSDGN